MITLRSQHPSVEPSVSAGKSQNNDVRQGLSPSAARQNAITDSITVSRPTGISPYLLQYLALLLGPTPTHKQPLVVAT